MLIGNAAWKSAEISVYVLPRCRSSFRPQGPRAIAKVFEHFKSGLV